MEYEHECGKKHLVRDVKGIPTAKVPKEEDATELGHVFKLAYDPTAVHLRTLRVEIAVKDDRVKFVMPRAKHLFDQQGQLSHQWHKDAYVDVSGPKGRNDRRRLRRDV